MMNLYSFHNISKEILGFQIHIYIPNDIYHESIFIKTKKIRIGNNGIFYFDCFY